MDWIVRMGTIGLMLVLTALPACNNTPISGNERLTLAYPMANGARVRVRHSTDGVTWMTVDSFPVLESNFNGPGTGATPDGVTYVVAGEEDHGGSSIKRWLCWSLGINSFSDLVDQPWSGSALSSAPSIAYAGNKKWLIAFRSAATVKVVSWDTGTSQATDLEYEDELNVSVDGRPALAIQGNRLVMTFYSDPPGAAPPRLLVVPGTISGGVPTFSPALVLSEEDPDEVELEKYHDLSHDTNNFVLAVVRKDPSSNQPLETHTLVIYDSEDGVDWTERTSFGVNSPLNRSVRVAPMAMGALSDGTVVAAFMTSQSQDVFRFANGAWSIVDGTSVFSDPPLLGREFSMISAGVP